MAIIIRDLPIDENNYHDGICWNVFCVIIFVFLFYRICLLESVSINQLVMINTLKTDDAAMNNFVPYLNDHWCLVENYEASDCIYGFFAQNISFKKTISGYKFIHYNGDGVIYNEFNIISVSYETEIIIITMDLGVVKNSKMIARVPLLDDSSTKHIETPGKIWRRLRL